MATRTTIQTKLLAIVTLVIVLTQSIFYIFSVNNQRKIFNDSVHDSAVSLAQALDASIGNTAELQNTANLQSNIYKMIWLSSNITAISIGLPQRDGIFIVASNETNSIGSKIPTESADSYQTGTITYHEIIDSDGTPSLIIASPVHIAGQRVGVYTIKMSLDALEAAIAKTQQEFLAITLISILFVVLILSFSIKFTVIDSLTELLEGMRRIGAGNLAYRVHTSRRDEIGDLFTGLNKMAQNLEDGTTELARAKSHTDVIIETLSDGLVEYTKRRQIRRINPVAERLLGVGREQILGKKIPQEATGDHLSSLTAVLGASLPGETRDIEVSEPLPTTLQVTTIALPTSEGGYVSLLRDVTREKLIEQDKNSFISVAAHQMRTPLAATKWALDSVLQDHDDEVSTAVRAMIQSSAATNNRMIVLVNDLLTVSRIEDGRYGFTFATNDICELVESIQREYVDLIKEKTLTFSLRCAPDIEQFLFDQAKLSIAIHALIDNAVIYTKSGDTIELSVEKESGNAVIKVADTGIGIPEESAPKLFTKFYRAHNAILASPNGSGLGLFIVKNIVAQHQGTVSAAPNKPRGTVFTITLPLHTSTKTDKGRA